MILEPRQHDITRNENDRMRESITTVRTYLKSVTQKKLTETEAEENAKLLDYLEHVLEFSATWNGVPTTDFFPDEPTVRTHLSSQEMLRLGGFFGKPFAEVSIALRKVDAEYPLLLQKLYEAYHLGSFHRRMMAKGISVQ